LAGGKSRVDCLAGVRGIDNEGKKEVNKNG